MHRVVGPSPLNLEFFLGTIFWPPHRVKPVYAPDRRVHVVSAPHKGDIRRVHVVYAPHKGDINPKISHNMEIRRL